MYLPPAAAEKRARKGGENSPLLEHFRGSKITKIYNRNNRIAKRLQ